MTRRVPNPAMVERHDDGGIPVATLAALEREAAHLTRRDGRRRLIVRRGCEPPGIEDDLDLDGKTGPLILAVVDLA